MNSFKQLHHAFSTFLHNQLQIPSDLITAAQFELNADGEKIMFGDINSNIALIAAKPLKINPRTLASQIAQDFKHPWVEKIEIAGPGFLNLFLTRQWFQ